MIHDAAASGSESVRSERHHCEQVMDYDKFSADDLCGSCTVKVSDLHLVSIGQLFLLKYLSYLCPDGDFFQPFPKAEVALPFFLSEA